MTNLNRKLKCLELEPEVLLHWLKEGNTWTILESEIPVEVEFRGVTHSSHNNCFVIFFSHDSFPIVPEGGVCPRINRPTCERIDLSKKIYEIVE